MAKPKRDPLGADYWKLTSEQEFLGGALTDDWLSLRDVIKRASNDTKIRVTGHVRWEKLVIFEILAVDRSRREDVFVKRGNRWQQWWEASGMSVTATQDVFHDLDRELGDITLS